MKQVLKIWRKPMWFLMALLFSIQNEAYASHAESADLTYKCLGGNLYEITVSFYRDCHGSTAPTSVTVNCLSASTGQNFNLTLMPVAGTGQEIHIVCSSVQTECAGGTYPGVQEWLYRGTATLSPASDWVLSFSLCCRNAAINTISSPGSQNIYVESTLDNLNYPCNSSPVFTTKPVPFACIQQKYVFNHGASDPDGDFLTYELITPMNAPGSSVTYLAPFSAGQPLSSTPPVIFDTLTGDITMTPTALEVTVLAVRVKQWRNNKVIGTNIRDMQLRTLNCNNSYPVSTGINGTGSYSASACAGSAIVFNIYTNDTDPGQIVTLSWNNGISGASFTVNGNPHPTGTFSWTPTANDIGSHCFTITVRDNNCPINGSQTFSVCLMVYGINLSVATTDANCNASNGTAVATVTGGAPPFTYTWFPGSGNNSSLNGLAAGTYTAMVTDAHGCTASAAATVNSGSAQGNTAMSSTPAFCYGSSDGTATVHASGGQPPYTYLWSTGSTGSGIAGLSPGTYYVTVSTAAGCTKNDSVVVIQPKQMSVSVSPQHASCFGMNNGSVTTGVSGGIPPYSYLWSNGQLTTPATGLSAGNYTVKVTDSKGCTSVQNVSVQQPAALTVSVSASTDVSCFKGADGTAAAFSQGGNPPYTYLWNTIPAQSSSAATGLPSGHYIVTVHDGSGCSHMSSVTISEPAPLVSSATFSNIKCYGDTSGTASVKAHGGAGGYSYLWSNGQTSFTASNLPAGTYSVTITDKNGCAHTDGVTISQPALLTANPATSQDVSCYGIQDGAASVNAGGGTQPYSYLWSTGQSSPSVNALAAGTHSVTVTDANGCQATTAVVISQPAPVVLSTSSGDSICNGKSAVISTTATGGTAPYTYIWSPKVGSGNTQTVSPGSTTTYTAVVTDSHGCTTTGSVTIFVYNMTLNLSLNATPVICSGQPATLSAYATGSNIVTYTWNSSVGGNGPGPYTVYPTSTTTYSVTATNSCGNTATAFTVVTVHPTPLPAISPQTAKGCDQVTMHFSDSNPGSGGIYIWNFGEGIPVSQPSPSHSYAQSGVYTVSVTVISPYGCTGSAQTTCSVTVVPSPRADFISDPVSVSILNPDFDFRDQSLNADQWHWDFGDGSTSSLQNPRHVYTKTGIYTVTLVTMNENMCLDSITRTVEVKAEFTFYIPNSFTPNGDQTNDLFSGKGTEVKAYHMQIFDRWGELIYETSDLEKGWDGTAKGGINIAQEGVYIYKIKVTDFENKEHDYIGNVNLIK